jgi:hypothetical protein
MKELALSTNSVLGQRAVESKSVLELVSRRVIAGTICEVKTDSQTVDCLRLWSLRCVSRRKRWRLL